MAPKEHDDSCPYFGDCKKDRNENLSFRATMVEKLNNMESILLEMKQDREKTASEFWKVMKEMQQQIYVESQVRLESISAIKMSIESIKGKAAGVAFGISLVMSILTLVLAWFNVKH